MTFAERIATLTESIAPIIRMEVGAIRVADLNLSASNPYFSEADYADTKALNAFIDAEKVRLDADVLIGGFNEPRAMYRRSVLFDQNLQSDNSYPEEPRNIHLGIDIWADAGTAVFAPLGGTVHSFAHNNNFGDYGPTIILKHELDQFVFYTLYGHLSIADLENVKPGDTISAGTEFAHFGTEQENGEWPPHLHFQVILDMGDYKGDYPGVCKASEADYFLNNCPNPAILIQII